MLIMVGLMIVCLGTGCGEEKQQPTEAQEQQAGMEHQEGVEEAVTESAMTEHDSRGADDASMGTVASENTPPKITSAKVVPFPAYTDTDLRVEVESEDQNGDLVNYRYQWIKIGAGETIESALELEGQTGPTLSHELFTRDDALAVKVIPSDWYSEGEPYQTRFVVVFNSAPNIVSTPPAAASDVYTYQVQAKDADDDSIRYALGEGAPAKMTIDAQSGIITWPITKENTGTYEVVVQAHDGHGGSSFQRFSMTVGAESAPETTAPQKADALKEQGDAANTEEAESATEVQAQ